MISMDWMRTLASVLDEPEGFGVVDLRVEDLELGAVYRRAWAAGGFRWGAIPKPPILSAAIVVASLRRLDAPVVVLTPVTGLSDGHEELLVGLYESGLDIRHVRAEGDLLRDDEGGLSFDPRRVLDRGGSTTIHLTIDRSHRCKAVDLPHNVRIELPTDGLPSVVGVAVESGFPGALPDQAWFRIEGAGSGKLTIDLEARSGEARWDLRYDDAIDGIFRIPAPPSEEDSEPPTRLAVILDRTCPDEAGWSAARAGGREEGKAVVEAEAAYGKSTTQTATAPVVLPGELNREVRTALGAALAGLLEGQDMLVDGWWFADTPGDGIAVPEGVTIGRRAVVNAGSEPPVRSPNLFESATWSPGFDLWDPLDEALDQAVRRLRDDKGRRGGVLIVGNSPPRFPLQRKSPLRKVASYLGFTTSHRRGSRLWHDVLDACEKEGVPVVYVFLTHGVHHKEEQKDYEVFRDLSAELQRALEACLPVVIAPAVPEGVTRGVAEALEILARPPRTVSGVRLVS